MHKEISIKIQDGVSLEENIKDAFFIWHKQSNSKPVSVARRELMVLVDKALKQYDQKPNKK